MKSINIYLLTTFVALLFAAFLDVRIVEWIAIRHNDHLIDFFTLVTDLGEGTEYFLIALLLLSLGLVNQGTDKPALALDSLVLRNYGWLCLKVLVVTGIILLFFKFGFGRSRPDLWLDHGILEFAPFSLESTRDFKSFPSGHTQTAFTAAVLLSLLIPRKFHFVLYFTASLVGLSRIFLLEHWPSDIIIGAVIGILVPLSIIRRSSWLGTSAASKVRPSP